MLEPLLGAHLFLQGLATSNRQVLDAAARATALRSIDQAFLGIAALIVALAAMIWTMRRLLREAAGQDSQRYSIWAALREAIASRLTVLGGLAIFLYVGAEVSIGTQMALLLHDGAVWNISLQRAGYFVSLYWLGAMVGRFAGSALLIAMPATRLLAIATAAAAALCLVVVAVGGVPAGFAALSIGLFNSIMFPTIFTITLERTRARHEATSGFLCLSIIGGAFLPIVAGAISDAIDYRTSFLLPAAFYACLCGFAVLAARTRLASR